MRPESKESDYADLFLCGSDINWHDYYYISPFSTEPESLFYCVNRMGVETHIPDLFIVERTDKTPYCEIFCILSGKGSLTCRGKTWQLHSGQLVLLPDREAHSYCSDPEEPFSKLWVEFYGSDSHRIIRHLTDAHGPVAEGPMFNTACKGIWTLQQHLMEDESMNTAADLYALLLSLLLDDQALHTSIVTDDMRRNFFMAESYINTHIGEEITNQTLASLCGISTPYFIKKFSEKYHCSPQRYILEQRIAKARYALTQTNRPVEIIAEQLGFCNPSYFIRRFRQLENQTPSQYRRLYSDH